ncbi:hypothetical protein Agabi119p4_5556 [Agaricus bisporus var. burnettii]|uniref:Regulator of volume decrease after cellular swelling-domain-containing protein n=2 Tax=Agaricus bisporus var. burnettii TaxID=192524 RepID=A0A8H7F1Y2_AGABI|nr:hypothetical protein Agabi119p4_5556 [Agaricus bisporus var. burnettii]
MPAIHQISSLPAFVSREQHTSIVASTPSSFNDIPPIVQHQEENVTVVLDPPLSEFSGDDLKGSLYVLTSALVFFSIKGRGFQVEYPSITLHAVSRGESGPSIYCQLDETSAEQIPTEDQQYDEMRELSIIPGSPESLEPIFEALSHCASLHPGDDVEEDNELDDAFIDPNTNNFETFNGTGDEELSEVGRAALEYLESIIYNPFEDAQDPSTGTPDQNERSENEQKETNHL